MKSEQGDPVSWEAPPFKAGSFNKSANILVLVNQVCLRQAHLRQTGHRLSDKLKRNKNYGHIPL